MLWNVHWKHLSSCFYFGSFHWDFSRSDIALEWWETQTPSDRTKAENMKLLIWRNQKRLKHVTRKILTLIEWKCKQVAEKRPQRYPARYGNTCKHKNKGFEHDSFTKLVPTRSHFYQYQKSYLDRTGIRKKIFSNWKCCSEEHCMNHRLLSHETSTTSMNHVWTMDEPCMNHEWTMDKPWMNHGWTMDKPTMTMHGNLCDLNTSDGCFWSHFRGNRHHNSTEMTRHYKSLEVV